MPQGGSHEQHVKAGQQTHKRVIEARYFSRRLGLAKEEAARLIKRSGWN